MIVKLFKSYIDIVELRAGNSMAVVGFGTEYKNPRHRGPDRQIFPALKRLLSRQWSK